MTHLPSTILLQCHNDRSQHHNRYAAMSNLRARLFKLERERLERELASIRGVNAHIE